MGFFTSQEEKERIRQQQLLEEKEMKRREEIAEKQQIAKEKAQLNALPGKYITLTFTSQTWSKTNRHAQTIIYQQIVGYANRLDLEIVNIGRMEEGLSIGVGIPVIFAKPN